MGFFGIFTPKTDVIVKTVKSKGDKIVPIEVTVGNIQDGFVGIQRDIEMKLFCSYVKIRKIDNEY